VLHLCGLANFGDGKIFTFNEGNALEMNKILGGGMFAVGKTLVTKTTVKISAEVARTVLHVMEKSGFIFCERLMSGPGH
jgi:hypothetical protein